jgi:prepilin-type processing-associated H-X9-DG protein
MRLDSIPAPARTIWLFDNGQRAAVAGPGNLHRTLHRGAAHILFLDGGVRRIQPTLAGELATQDQPLWNP